MNSLPDLLKALSKDVPPTIIEACEDATRARELVKPGSVEDGPDDLHEQLLGNRVQIERMEYLVASLTLLKSRSQQSVAASRAAYDDAYAKSATKPSVGFTDYTTAKEKDAHHNLSAMAELVNLRTAEKTHRDVDSAWDYCRILLRGAEGVQRDLETRIRLITLRSSLER